MSTSLLKPFAFLFVAALALPAVAQDTVTLKDGKTEQGRVKSADYDGVVVEAKGAAKTIEWSQVASIAYKDPPEEYVAGIDAYSQQKWDDAIASFDKLKSDSKARGPIRQDALYYTGAAHLSKGNWDGVVATFDVLRKDFPKGRYMLEIGEGYVTAFSAKKDYAAAQKMLDTMNTDAATSGLGQGFSATISLLKGRLLEDQGKIPEAAAAYGVAEKTTGAAPLVQQQARLGQGRCLLHQKKGSDAEAIFRKLTGEDAPNIVLAGAWNGLGDIWKQDALAKTESEQVEKLYDAAYAYMRGVVQFGPGPGESAREYRRSLQGAADTFKGLVAVEKNAEKKKVYQARYQERVDQLNREFPSGK